MKKNSTTNQSTEEKDEKMKTIEDIRKHLDKYENIKNSKKFTYRQKDILSLMLFRGNGQDEGFTMGYKHITDTFGYSSTAISAAISLFKDYNFISVEKGHTGTNSKYTLNYEAMKNFKSSSTVSVSDSEIREAKSEKRSKIREEKTYDTVIQLLTRLLSDLQIREEKRRESEKRYIADIQALIRLLSDKFDTVIDLMNQRLNININNNINKNLKDNISSNNNTEGNNIKDQNKKKNISTGNLEKLKENSNDEIFNDEDIQRENESLDEIENTSKVESSKDEISNESRIPSDEDNISSDENPNDMPPLDVDSLFEDDSNPLTEYRTNENLNEENETSRDENSKENENSKANGSSKEDGGLSEDKNPSDENSKANENPEDNEMDCSVFGDSNSTDEDKDKDNDKWYESSRSTKSENHANGMFTNLISELTSNNPKANEISNDNNSKTSENMKKTNNKTNTIPSEGKNPSDENPKANENLNAFGKLQSFRDLKTGRIDGYQFNSYDNLNDSRDYSKSFHASVLCINLEPSDLKKVSVSDTGVWGILNRTNGVYSFFPSNVCPSYAPNNALQVSKTSEVDNYTTEGEITAGNSVKMCPEASDSNTNTTADNKKDEKTTETVYADENTDEVDNYTTEGKITAGNSVKMRPEASDEKVDTPIDEEKDEKTIESPSNDNKEAESQSNNNNTPQASKTSEVDSNTTNTEKVDSTQLQIANKASNAGVLDGLDGKTKAMIEELMKRDAAKKVTPMGRDYFKGAPDRWKEIHLKCAYAGGNNGDLLTIEEAIENYSSYESPRLHLDAIRTYAEEICKRMRKVLADNVITQEQFNAFSDVFYSKSEAYKAACAEEFKKNKPTTESEKWMYNWIYKKKNVKN